MNELIFNGKNFTEFNAYYATSNFLDGAAKDVQSVSVVGRSGDLQLSNNRYKNLSLKIRVYVTRDMEASMRAMRNYLESVHGYARVEISDQPNEFRMAAFKEMFAPDSYDSKVGVVDLTFDSMPQRFLKTGENWTTVSSSSSEISGNPVSISNPSGLTALTGLNVDIEPVQDLNGYDHPWVGGAGKNLLNIHDASGWTIPRGGELSVNGETVSMKILAGGNTRYMLNQHLEGNKTVTITFTSSKKYGRLFVTLRKMDDSGWMTNSDASIDGLIYNQYYNGWYTYFGGTSASQTIIIPNCLYWQFGLGYGNNEVVTGATETIGNPMIRLASETDDTYEPYSNICPITGHTSAKVTRTGKNLLPSHAVGSTTISGVTFTVAEDGTITANGTATAVAIFAISTYTLAEGTYILNGCPSGGSNTTYYIDWRNDSGGQLTDKGNGSTQTSEGQTGKSCRIVIYNGQTVNNLVFNPMIRLASDTDATYEPYIGHTVTVDLNGTRYGGTLDVSTGVLTVDRVMVDLGTLTWIKRNTSSGHYRFTANTDIYMPSSTTAVPNIVCSAYPTISPADSWVGVEGISCNTGAQQILVSDESYNDASSFTTGVNGVQLVYELATPTTVQLTAQQLSLLTGTNIISTDMNSLTVTLSNPAELENPTLFESKPIIRVYGNGTLNVNDIYITVANSPYTYIDIDCELMDCYYDSNNANQYVSFSTTDYVTLRSGMNYFSYSGFTKVEVTPRWFEV